MKCSEILTIIIQAIAAIGTLLIAILALWGGWIKFKFFGPKLAISLYHTEGDLTYITDGTPGRYYKLRVSNRRKWAPAKNVRVMLKKVFKPAADGAWSIQPFSGPLQMTWQWFPPQYQTIGPDQICTFGNLIKG